ncbi:PPE family protein [Mycobacterium tuberculosis]|nr:PPE family protein [Mycobacterium tuberculosis]
MEKMSHDPIAADIGTQVSDNALHGVTAGSTALTSVTGLVPAGADEVSAQAATAFTSEGIQLLASNASAQDQLHRAAKRSRTSPAPIRKSTTAPPASSPNRPPTHRRE